MIGMEGRGKTHGESNKTAEYRCWTNMWQRCTNPNNPGFIHYGARGIKVCDRWKLYENFLMDMGRRPEGHQIDREDNDGDYSPENCRWVTREVNNMNRSVTLR